MATVRRTKRFRIVVAMSEPGRVRLSALVERRSGRTVALAPGRKMTFRKAGRRRVTFRVTSAGLRLLKARPSVVLRVRAKATFSSGRTLPAVQVRRRLR